SGLLKKSGCLSDPGSRFSSSLETDGLCAPFGLSAAEASGELLDRAVEDRELDNAEQPEHGEQQGGVEDAGQVGDLAALPGAEPRRHPGQPVGAGLPGEVAALGLVALGRHLAKQVLVLGVGAGVHAVTVTR